MRGHTDLACLDKRCKKPPLMSLWVRNDTCMKYKKKGHLSFSCTPKYACSFIVVKNK